MPEPGYSPAQEVGKVEQPRLSAELEARYITERSHIRDVYQRVGTWHGTGRYDLENNGTTRDVLTGMLESGEIKPHQDIWDGSLRTVHTTSATWIRPYATYYSDMHLTQGEDELFFVDPRKWGRFIQRLTAPYALSLLKDVPYIWQQRKAGSEWVAKKTGQEVKGKGTFGFIKEWRRLFKFRNITSSIPGDYPVLIGLAPDAFEPIKTAGYIAATEKRTDQPISLDKVTHIEVPLKYVEQTRDLVQQKGKNIEVLPREFGERYSTEFSQADIVSGKAFAHPPAGK